MFTPQQSQNRRIFERLCARCAAVWAAGGLSTLPFPFPAVGSPATPHGTAGVDTLLRHVVHLESEPRSALCALCTHNGVCSVFSLSHHRPISDHAVRIGLVIACAWGGQCQVNPRVRLNMCMWKRTGGGARRGVRAGKIGHMPGNRGLPGCGARRLAGPVRGVALALEPDASSRTAGMRKPAGA